VAQRPAVAAVRLQAAALMEVLTAVLAAAGALPAPAVLAVAAVLLVVESGTPVGMFLPGTTLLVALGLWVHIVPEALPAAPVVAAASTVAGAHIGWWRSRNRTDRGRWPALDTRAEQARGWLAGRGPLATAGLLFCGHWAAAARPIMPRVAGGAGVPYRIAGPALVVSGSAWATTLVLLGNGVGPHVLTHAGWAPVVVVVLLIGALTLQARRDASRGAVDESRLIHLSSPHHARSTSWPGGPRPDRPLLAGRPLAAAGPGRP
jgi:membrane-associated protein